MSNVQPGPEELVIVEGDLRPGVEVGDMLLAVDVEPGTIVKNTHGELYRRAEPIHAAFNYAGKPHWRPVDFVTAAEHAVAARRARMLGRLWWVVVPATVVVSWVLMLTVTHWAWPGIACMAAMVVYWWATYRSAARVACHVVIPDAVTFDPEERS